MLTRRPDSKALPLKWKRSVAVGKANLYLAEMWSAFRPCYAEDDAGLGLVARVLHG